MKKTIVILLCLVFLSLACLSTSAAVNSDPNLPIEISPTLTNAPRAAAPTMTTALMSDSPVENCAVVIADEALHLRGGPSANDIVLTWLDRDDLVHVIEGGESEWWRVSFEGVEGFARSIYLQESECVK